MLSKVVLAVAAYAFLSAFLPLERRSFGNTFTEIDFPGAVQTGVTGISGSMIVGTYFASNGSYHGFTEQNGVYTSVDFPGDIANGPNTGTNVTGVFGNTIIGTHGFDLTPYMEAAGTFVTLPLAPGASFVEPLGIDNGTVVGYTGNTITNSPLFNAGFSESDGVYALITPPGATVTAATGISGDTIVGSYYAGVATSQGFIDKNGTFADFNFPGAMQTALYGIDGNTIVGSYSEGVVGSWYDFAYVNGVFITLDVPGSLLEGTVEGIDPIGVSGNMVAGTYTDVAGIEHGFAMALPAPEPATIAIGATGILLITRRRRIL